MIEVRCRAEGETIVLEIVGDLCLVTAPVVVSCIDAAVDSGARHLVLDVAEVGVFGATGANLAIETGRRLAALGGSFAIRNASGLTSYVLDVTGLGEIVEPHLGLTIAS